MQIVLYVGQDATNPQDYCPGSVLCLASVQKLRAKINVQDTSVLRERASLPAWLNGTPILIDDQGGRPMRGMEAYRHLQSLVQKEAVEDRARERRPAARQAKAEAPMTRIDPAMTRQPSAKRTHLRPAEKDEPEEAFALSDGDDDETPVDATAHGQAASGAFSNEKVTDDDLQRFMQQRNASPAASASPNQSS